MGLRGTSTWLAERAFANLTYYSGLLDMQRKRVMRSTAVILLYHRIVDEPPELLDYSPSGMTLRRDMFESQMAFLRRHYRLVALGDLVRSLSVGETLGDMICSVTFDDGWRDNYTHAFPILKKYDVPATIFLTTNFIDGAGWFWEERLKYVVAHLVQCHLDQRVSAEDDVQLRARLRELNLNGMLDLSVHRLRRLLTTLVVTLRERPTGERDGFMHALETLLQLPSLAEPRRFMNWHEIREMRRDGVEFGAHTRSHVNLERCDARTAEAEILGSRMAIDASLRHAPALFAYPFGKNTATTRSLVSEAGFAAAVTTRCGLVESSSDAMRLNRIDIHDRSACDLPYFACRILNLVGSR